MVQSRRYPLSADLLLADVDLELANRLYAAFSDQAAELEAKHLTVLWAIAMAYAQLIGRTHGDHAVNQWLAARFEAMLPVAYAMRKGTP